MEESKGGEAVSENGTSTLRERDLQGAAHFENGESPTDKKTLSRMEKKKRSIKRTLALLSRVLLALSIVVPYILLGACVMHFVESPAEEDRITRALALNSSVRQEVIDSLFNLSNDSNSSTELADTLITKIVGATSQGAFQRQERNWEYEQSVFFVITAITTIGFGNVSAETFGGRTFIVIYALFGIPLTFLLLANIGKLLSRIFKSCLKPFSKYLSLLIISYVVLLAFFLIGVLCLPAVVFTYVEKWSYHDSVYFCFIALSTIGFGDIVVLSSDDVPEDRVARVFYSIFIFIWLFVGLAYLTLVIQECIVAFSLVWKKLAMKIPFCKLAAAEEDFEERPLVKLAGKAGRKIKRIRKTISHYSSGSIRRTANV